MDRGPAQAIIGVKELPDQPKMPTITTMKLKLVANVHQARQTKLGTTEIIIVIVTELALGLDGVKEHQDENSYDFYITSFM